VYTYRKFEFGVNLANKQNKENKEGLWDNSRYACGVRREVCGVRVRNEEMAKSHQTSDHLPRPLTASTPLQSLPTSCV
jgi:hypothetical protein